MTFLQSIDYLESDQFPFHAALYIVKVHERIDPHSHEFIEFVYISKGEGFHEYRGGVFPIGQGDVFVIEPHLKHTYEVAGKNNLLVYNILFQPSLLTDELLALSIMTPFVDFFYLEPLLRRTVNFEAHLRLQPSEQLKLQHMLDEIITEFEGKEMGYRFLVKTKLMETFIFLSRCYDKKRQRPLTALGNEDHILDGICRFIEHHYASQLTLGQVSQLCSMSPANFAKKFKAHTNLTLLEYRNKIRIDLAQRLLRDTNDKVISIAQEAGFEDVSNFNRAFKQLTGLSPGQFRRNAAALAPRPDSTG